MRRCCLHFALYGKVKVPNFSHQRSTTNGMRPPKVTNQKITPEQTLETISHGSYKVSDPSYLKP